MRTLKQFVVHLLAAHTMLLKEFYVNVISSEADCIRFLQNNALLGDVDAHDPCHKCGSQMAEKRRKNRNGEFVPVMRCPKKGCQATRTFRSGNALFQFTDLNGRNNSHLTLCQIMELIYMFVAELPVTQVVALTSRAPLTVTSWFETLRDVSSQIIAKEQKMLGTRDNPIQIDEARFAGRRKYNRGRMLTGDFAPTSEDAGSIVVNKRNHGARIDGPWVFGLRLGDDCRYFVVEKRDRGTLIPIIRRECERGSVIHSDEWPAYGSLTQEGYVHETVNHQQHYVDPDTGAHTQAIERSWLDAKIDILKKKRGVPLYQLQSHLDYYCWHMYRKNEPDKFIAFLDDIRTIFT
jgi:transposase